jgi:hypothetical protein
MEPWYRVATPRKEVREGRSFNPDEFAIALEQVVAGTAPEDYRNPEQFFARTCFTRALREHARLVLRRLSGRTDDTAPVLTLITQFGGGKTHTLTALYHLATSGQRALRYGGISELLREADLSTVPSARVGVFVGNAWDPQAGRETPWIDIARQLAGEAGVEALGAAAKTTPPGTESIARVFRAANAPVLLLFDEVLNFLNRHRSMAESFHAFLQNLTVAVTGTTHGAAVISLPRSQVEMTDWDIQWQEKIGKVVRRVARDLIVNDEAEIGEVVRRRLFEDLGSDRIRKKVAKAFADWCFERRVQLPPEWTAVDTAATEAKAKEHLLRRFEACYPFHPATLSVFQRKWQALPQYQQTRGTLAMLAQWIAWAYRDGFTTARLEPLVTLGSAPLHDRRFRSTILGQLGESRLDAAIDADIAGEHSHARALDADTKGPLCGIHRRVGTVILFESSGGQTEKVAHLPELRFALGEPKVDTTSIDNAAFALEDKSYFIRKVGSDGFKISPRPTMKKIVSDRRASLDEEHDIKPAVRKLIEEEFRRGATVPVVSFPGNGADVPEARKLTLVAVDPEKEWTGDDALRKLIAEWTWQRGNAPRLYPGSLVWCLKKPGRELREKVEILLAWKRVAQEVEEGSLGSEFDRKDHNELKTKLTEAREAARDEVWAGYRYAVVADAHEPDRLKIIDLGAGYSSGGDTLCGRVLSALTSEGLLNDSVCANYLEQKWPPLFRESGAWPLASLLQSFLDGSLTRLLHPETTLRGKIVEFVARGDFGLASGSKAYHSAASGALQAGETYERVWFKEPVSSEEIDFGSESYLLTKAKAQQLKAGISSPPPSFGPSPKPFVSRVHHRGPGPDAPPTDSEPASNSLLSNPSLETEAEPRRRTDVPIQSAATQRFSQTNTVRLVGTVPCESWNRLGTKLLPKLRSRPGIHVRVAVEFSVTVDDPAVAEGLHAELPQVLEELGLTDELRIETE